MRVSRRPDKQHWDATERRARSGTLRNVIQRIRIRSGVIHVCSSAVTQRVFRFSPFYIGVYEVTQTGIPEGDWETNPSKFKKDEFPVESLTFAEAARVLPPAL